MLARRARSRDPRRTSTMTKPPTTPRGCMRLRRAPKSTAKSTIRRLRLCEPVRCKRKRWTSGTSHLAMVNSRCAHGLQKTLSAQPTAIARLARKIRSCRLETSISLSLIPWVTSWPSGNHWVLPRCRAWSQTLAERLKGESSSIDNGELVAFDPQQENNHEGQCIGLLNTDNLTF